MLALQKAREDPVTGLFNDVGTYIEVLMRQVATVAMDFGQGLKTLEKSMGEIFNLLHKISLVQQEKREAQEDPSMCSKRPRKAQFAASTD